MTPPAQLQQLIDDLGLAVSAPRELSTGVNRILGQLRRMLNHHSPHWGKQCEQ